MRSTAGARPKLFLGPVVELGESGGENRAEAAHPSAALRRLGVRPRRALSQSFLTSPAIAAAMVDAAGLDSGQTVVEIGPGLGIVTQLLAATGARIVAVELDDSLAQALPGTLGHPANLSVVQGDALEVDFSDYVDEPFSVVASLPYHVATPILFKLLFETPAATQVVAMLQAEVAQRITATRHPLTYLGIAVRLVAEARLVRHVPPGAFYPVPKVRSAVVALERRPHLALNGKEPDMIARFVRLGFTQPRQQLHNSLARGLGTPASDVQHALQAAGIDPRLRPGDLEVAEWVTLFDAFGEGTR